MAAGLGFKTFATGDVLSAADVNGYLMQGVLVFASAAARNAAITSPQEGQFAFTKDTNGLWYYDGATWVASGATGDIEGVSVTSPINGGGTSGTVTIGIDSTAIVPSQTGNAGKYLTTNGTASSWGTISAGGMTLLDSGALSGASVTTASLSQSYKDLYIIVRDWYPSTDAVRIRGRVNGVSAANSYNQGIAAGTAGSEAFNSDYFGMSIDTDNTVHKNILTIDIPDYANTSTYKYISTTSFAVDSTTTANLSKYCGIYAVTAATSAISTFTFLLSSGNFSGGNYYVYGVN